MSSNGPPPKDYPEVPTSPPAPSPSVKRKVVDGTECSKVIGVQTLVTLAMLGGMFNLEKSESEDL